MTRTELLLKSIMLPGEPVTGFDENYLRLFSERDLDTFKTIVEIKGYTKNDAHIYIDVYNKKLNQQLQHQHQHQQQQLVNKCNNSSNNNIEILLKFDK